MYASSSWWQAAAANSARCDRSRAHGPRDGQAGAAAAGPDVRGCGCRRGHGHAGVRLRCFLHWQPPASHAHRGWPRRHCAACLSRVCPNKLPNAPFDSPLTPRGLSPPVASDRTVAQCPAYVHPALLISPHPPSVPLSPAFHACRRLLEPLLLRPSPPTTPLRPSTTLTTSRSQHHPESSPYDVLPIHSQPCRRFPAHSLSRFQKGQASS